MSIEQINALIAVGISNNLESLKCGDIEIKFRERERVHRTDAIDPAIADDMPPDDEMLFYATDAYDNMKKTRAEAMKPEPNI